MVRAGETVEDRQNRFLIAFRDTIADVDALSAAGVSSSAVYKWRRNDVNGFNARYEEACQDRASNTEALMFEVLQFAKSPERLIKLLQYPSLLMFALRGAYPEKYGEKGIAGQDDAKRLLEELMKLKADEPVGSADEVKTLDQQLEDLLGKGL